MAKERAKMASQNGSSVADGVASHSNPSALTFEQALSDLELLVRKLEDGELDMDGALAAYEQGLARLKRCHALLAAAELKVEQVTGINADANAIAKPFDVDSAE